MRWLAPLAILLAAAPAVAQDYPAPAQPYFPAGTWGGTDHYPRFDNWFGRHLESMREPIFWADDALVRPGKAPWRARYRLLVLPTFGAPYAVRIDASDGGATARFVITRGYGGYGPGPIDRDRRIVLGPKPVAAIVGALAAARFGERAGDPDASEGEFGEPKSPDDPIRVCADGTQFVVEVRDRGGYHAVTRHRCDLDRPMRSLVIALAQAGGIRMAPAALGL
jgi:hypothetical protein